MSETIKQGVQVSWKSRGKTLYGNVVSIDGDSALIKLNCDYFWGERRTISLNRLTYEPPVILTKATLRQFSRFDITYTELMQNRTYADIKVVEAYQIVPEDLKAAVENYHNKGVSMGEFANEYFWPLWDDIYNAVGIETALNGPDDGDEVSWMPDQYSVFSNAWDIFIEIFEYGEDDVSLDDVITEVQTWLDNKDKPMLEREFSKEQKWNIIRYWTDNKLEASDPDVKTIYRKALDSLCEGNDLGALRKKAYACYGKGNAAYGQDWKASQECLLKLMELDPNPETANTLGYMYYYGRCTDGVPEYDKAFYYFSIGAAGWYYESRYKLADMFLHGYGVSKNPKVVWSIIWELYEEQLEKICNGGFQSNFADVALRAGNLYRDGINCYGSPDEAFYYYLQARYAIRMRMLSEDNYGDQSVAAGIEKAISEILPETSYAKPASTVHMGNLYDLLRYGLDKKHHMEMKVKRISESEAKLTFRIVPFEDEKYKQKLFVTVPPLHFCELLEKITVTAKDIEILDLYDGGDKVLFDSIQGNEFCLYGRTVARIQADFVYKKYVSRGKKYRFASVTFNLGGRRYDYLCDESINQGDKAIVLTTNGERIVNVEAVFEKTESELTIPVKQYKRILRKATN